MDGRVGVGGRNRAASPVAAGRRSASISAKADSIRISSSLSLRAEVTNAFTTPTAMRLDDGRRNAGDRHVVQVPPRVSVGEPFLTRRRFAGSGSTPSRY
jgi:hypothetical protein